MSRRWFVPLAVLAGVVVGALAGLSAPVALGLGAALLVVSLSGSRSVAPAVIVVGLCPVLSGISRDLGVGPFKLSEALLLVGAAMALFQWPAPGQRTRAPEIALIGYAAIAAFFAGIHTLLGESSITSFFRVGLVPGLLLLTYWTCSRSVRSRADLIVVLRWLILASAVPAVFAIGQGFDFPGVRQLLIDITDGGSLAKPGQAGVARVTSIFPDWHTFAAYLLIPTVLSVLLLLRKRWDVLPRYAVLGVLALDSAALLLTVTATVAAWAVAAVLLLGWRRGQLGRASVALVVVAVVGGTVFAGPISARIAEQEVTTALVENAQYPPIVPQTIIYRLTVWNRDYVPLLQRAVPRGVSNDLPKSVLFAHSENAYITLMLRGGLLLVVATVFVMVLLGRDLARWGRRDDITSAVADGLLCVLLFLPVATMIWPYFTNAGFPQTFFAMTGAVTGAALGRHGIGAAIESTKPAALVHA
jgi:hypothetical protein